MSDDFIPFNQSTPKHRNAWRGRNNQGQNWSQNSPNNFYNNQNNFPNNQNNFYNNGPRRNSGGYNNRWNNSSPRNSRNSSFGSDRSNNTNNSGHSVNDNIDAYLHPAMLKDPWEHLREASLKNP